MFKIKQYLNLKYFGAAALVSFVSVNIYWLLTVTYTLPVKKVGEQGVLVGFEAANYLIKLNGVSIYLSGMLGYYLVSLLFCLTGIFIYRKQNNTFILVSLSGILALLGAIIYYIFSVKIFIKDNVEGVNYVLSGIDALMSMSLMQLTLSITGIWLILFFTIVFSVKLSKTK